METPTVEELKGYLETGEGPHVSIFMPVETAGPEVRQNAIRLKNLLRAAEEEMVATGVRAEEARRLLEPGWQLEDNAEFWDARDTSLALYLASDFFQPYWLPAEVDEMVTVSDRFHFRPVIQLLNESEAFYLLALSMNEVRFFRCTRFTDQELKVEGLPESMAEALWADDPEPQLQFRSQPMAQSGGQGGRGGSAAIFHGSGDAVDDDTKDRLRRYFLEIDRALQPVLARSRRPLVLASVDYLQPIYRDVSTYKDVHPEGISGNPETVRSDELRNKAWQLVSSRIDEERAALLERYHNLAGTGLHMNRLEDIILAAEQGRVDSILYAADARLWGVAIRGAIAVHGEKQPGDEELIDRAIVETVTRGGGVAQAYNRKELPDNAVTLAILRY